MAGARVLICDDNESVHDSLTSYLNNSGISVISVYDGQSALDTLQIEQVDLVILDVMLPGIFGTDVCKRIRQRSDVPIIMLSARGEESDRILGLELGADDYVTKPFSPREVAARVLAILKRAAPQKETDKLRFRSLCVDEDAYEVSVRGKKLDFTPKEVRMLAFFTKNAGTALTRDRIMNDVWGYNYFGDTRAVDTLVKRIRQKLAPQSPDFEIVSVYGIGYKLEAV